MQETPSVSRPPLVVVFLLGLVGGVAGVLTALYQEMLYGGVLLPVLVAPAIEEVCKPIGVVFMLEKRAHWLRGRRQVVLLALLGALVFATLENVAYVHLYQPKGSLSFALWRYTVCTGMHLTASAVFGVGLAKMWRHIRQTGGRFDIDHIFRYYVAAVVIHSAYNSIVLILHHTRVLRF
jgi:RsiW-degrading membrane proteinase PrsW (M82 family)